MNWNIVVFAIWPYVALTIFIVGHVWRWRTDQFGWTSRTTELMEKRWLLLASPLFHVGLLLVILGHAAGLLIPASWTAAMGIPDHVYHLMAVSLGTIAGVVFTAGIVLLILRRFIWKTRFRLITRPGDWVMYIVLAIQVVLGLWQTLGYGLFGADPSFDYRESVSIWFRSVFYLHPDVNLMTGAPLIFQLHAVTACLLFAVWPFSRLVHVWSAPFGYLTRPPIVYRKSRITMDA